MIIELGNTTTSAVSKRLVSMREEGGAVALGRVLTLVISTGERRGEAAIAAANSASGEHPMRVIVIHVVDRNAKTSNMDAEIRVGGDAGASEVIVLHVSGPAADDPETLVQALLLPDAPVVAWWPDSALGAPSASSLGRIAQLRIVDSGSASNGGETVTKLAEGFCDGDSDLAWTRLTSWRAQIAAVLDQPPYEPIQEVEVIGRPSHTSTLLMAAWLQLALQVPVRLAQATERELGRAQLRAIKLTRPSGVVTFERVSDSAVVLTQPGQPEQKIPMPVRDLPDVLAEELRSLGPDRVFGEVLAEAAETEARDLAVAETASTTDESAENEGVQA